MDNTNQCIFNSGLAHMVTQSLAPGGLPMRLSEHLKIMYRVIRNAYLTYCKTSEVLCLCLPPGMVSLSWSGEATLAIPRPMYSVEIACETPLPKGIIQDMQHEIISLSCRVDRLLELGIPLDATIPPEVFSNQVIAFTTLRLDDPYVDNASHLNLWAALLELRKEVFSRFIITDLSGPMQSGGHCIEYEITPTSFSEWDLICKQIYDQYVYPSRTIDLFSRGMHPGLEGVDNLVGSLSR